MGKVYTLVYKWCYHGIRIEDISSFYLFLQRIHAGKANWDLFAGIVIYIVVCDCVVSGCPLKFPQRGKMIAFCTLKQFANLFFKQKIFASTIDYYLHLKSPSSLSFGEGWGEARISSPPYSTHLLT